MRHVCTGEREVFGPQRKGYRPAFTRLQRYLFEALQFLHRPGNRSDKIAHVELHYLFTRARARVGNRGSCGDRTLGSHRRSRQRCRRIAECRVAETITEAVQWIVRRIEITRDVFCARLPQFNGTTGILHVVVDRRLPHIDGEGDRQFARRVVITEQHVCDRVAALRARIPRMQNGGHVVVCPGDRIGATAHHHQHDRFARCNELFEQGLLIAWQVERGTAGSFARHVPFFAHDRDDNVRRFRQR